MVQQTAPLWRQNAQLFFFALLLALQASSSRLAEVAEEEQHCVQDGPRLTCNGLLPAAPNNEVLDVRVNDWPEIIFDPRSLTQTYKNVKNLTIQGDPNTMRRFTHAFPAGLGLQVLNISRLGLVALEPPGLFDNLANTLVVLDASHNQLHQLAAATLSQLTYLKAAYFEGNPWKCGAELSWLLNASLTSRLLDLASWECGPAYQGKSVLPVLQMQRTLLSQCPSRPPYNCSCILTNVVPGMSGVDPGFLIPVITVNCTARGLYRAPPYLPVNTTTLILSKNMISDVRPLAMNPHYRQVKDIFLDNNQIRSIATLEGAEWLTTCRVFSLRNNYLSQIPVYAIDNGLGKNKNLAQLYLGNNPWVCDCMFTPGFQDLLAKYQSVIKDANDIRCALREADENSFQPIRHLSRSLLCQEPKGGLSGLDILNVSLALCILLVLGKLAYDYWSFKTSGRLPWLVAKMP
ncbi:protein singed wings 2 [Neocloeon triangulifer]|uniref:protein singed wings 2 n=1 Tax=Neocloeon triangulifer TaxID=2078957 RepID=UPI00286ECA01|nr:protein singed wings 2 [Neocloeon triangulifer]